MPQIPQPLTEADIFARIVHPHEGNLPQDISRLILDLQFEAADVARMNELAERNSRGLLNETERQEMEKYLRVGHFLNRLHAKARQSLQHSSKMNS